ncbi:MAG: ribonuclease HII [Deltaproteobacteria bacterium]|nr:ribonuclease HII [Deltaproteobacteria bacterium]
MSDELPLALLIARAREATGARELARLLRALEGDPRAGAGALARRVERRLAEARAERARVGRLFALRRQLRRAGAQHVAGVDEVGMGPLAGPVVAAAVILPDRVELPGLDDSKRVPRPVRERLAEAIRAQAVALAVGEVEPAELDRLNVYRAGLEAMRRAVVALAPAADHLLVDARTVPGTGCHQTRLVQGDSRDGSIAAASIVAKVHRDAIMRRLEDQHPGYGFARHMGYATREHLAALRRLGPCPAHRRSFQPCAQPTLL